MNTITPVQIKRNNCKIIYDLLYQSGKASKQEIASRLHLSLPTVTQNLVHLEELGLIEKAGHFSSQVGRRAAAYDICPSARVAIGVEILKTSVRILAVDLKGRILSQEALPFFYEKTDAYCRLVSQEIQNFARGLPVSSSQILGVGFALQALVSPDGQRIVYGKILECTDLSVSAFLQHLPFPCRFLHDADCAAISELWADPHLKNGMYLSIGKHLGAALIWDGEILAGKHGHSATIEHMQMDAKGSLCYCGQRGCLETWCSLTALLKENESLEDFFTALRKDSPRFQKRWQQFLDHLATAINNLHLVFDGDYILGGHIAPYLLPRDVEMLHQMIREKAAFPEEADFIQISRMPVHNVPIGAALPFVREFLGSVLAAV